MVNALILTLLISWSFVGVRPSYQQDLLAKPLSVAALGRVALMGELYDAREDTFLGLSLLDSRPPKELISSTQNRHSDVKYLMLNTIEEKMSILDVRAEAKLSLMLGMIEVSGSAKFFNDKKQSSRSVKVSLANLVKSEYEQINLSGRTLRSLIDLDMLKVIDATHVVVVIQWGGNVFISVEDSDSTQKDQQLVEGHLGGKLEFLMNSISVNGSVQLDNKEISEFGKFNFELYGDILPTETPATLIDAVKLMKSSSSMLTEGNSGKGKAMSYYLLSIGIFRDLLNFEAEVNTVLKSVDSLTINSCVQLFEELEDVERKIGELMLNRKAFERYVVKDKLEYIVQMANDYDNYKKKLTQELGEVLVAVRSGNASVSTLLEILHVARQDKLSPSHIDFEQFYSVQTEFRFLQLLTNLDVTILSKEKSFEEFMSENFNANIYAFFYTIEYPSLLQRPMSVFMTILEQRKSFDPKGVFVAIKSDIIREGERNIYFNFSEPTRLRVYKNGYCLAENYSENSTIGEIVAPEIWSFHRMQTQVATLMEKTAQLSQTTDDNFKKSVPIGFVYVQYPEMSEPRAIWPTFKWKSITENFANGFFRAEGSRSGSFGSYQLENSPRITNVELKYEKGPHQWDEAASTTKVGWTNWLGVAGEHGTWRTIRFRVQGGEVRPSNYAIRIWKRIG